MTEDTHEDQLLAQLRDLGGRVDPVPAHVLDAARGSLSWRDTDAALAALVTDSATAGPAALAGVRGGDQPRLLTFTAGDLTIEVEAAAEDAATVRLVGQLVPPQRAQLRVEHAGGGPARPASADELGRFAVAGVPAGPVRLRCEPAGPAGRVVLTAWVVL